MLPIDSFTSQNPCISNEAYQRANLKRQEIEENKTPTKTTQVATQKIAHAVQYPKTKKVVEILKVDPESLFNEEELSGFKNDSLSLAHMELKLLQEKVNNSSTPKKVKLPDGYSDLKKRFLNCKGLTKEQAIEKNLKCLCSLYKGWKEITSNPSLSFNEKEKAAIQFELKKLHDSISKAVLKKTQEKKLELKTISCVAKEHIPSCHESKFHCPINSGRPKKDYEDYKEQRSQQSWSKNLIEIKEFKKKLKKDLEAKVEHDLSLKTNGFGSKSFPIKVAYEEFQYLLKTLNDSEDKSLKTHFKILNETIEILDAYYKEDGLLRGDEVYSCLYLKMAKTDGSLHILYLKSEECYRKKNPSHPIHESIPIDDDETTIPLLIEFLNDICKHLNQKLKFCQKEEQIEKNKLTIESLNETINSINNYFDKLIKFYKNHSYKRFINLFTVYQTFVNRLDYILSKIEDVKNSNRAQSIISARFHPNVSLFETGGHRGAHQGGHCVKTESAKIRKHDAVAKINPYIRFATLGEPHDLTGRRYEASHQEPFPTFIVIDDVRKRAISKVINHYPETSTAFPSLSYAKASPEEQEKLFKNDINALWQSSGKELDRYIDLSLDLLCKLILEELSKTNHFPKLLNNIADGTSEKFIELREDNQKIMKQFLSFKEHNEKINPELKKYKAFKKSKKKSSSKEEVEETIQPEMTKPTCQKYTEKKYKYLLANVIDDLINPVKPIKYEQVLEKSESYIIGTKEAIAKRLGLLTNQPKTISNLLLAISIINVFYGVKNAEAKANADNTKGDKEVVDSIKHLSSKWEENNTEPEK